MHSARRTSSKAFVAAAFLLLGTFVMPSAPQAQGSRIWDDCQGLGGISADDAINACTNLIRGNGETTENRAIAYYNRAIHYDRIKKPDIAIQDYDESLRLNPRYASAYYNRGNIYRNKKDHSKAISDYDQALRFNPQHANAYNNRGNSHKDLGNLQQAISDYSSAVRIKPDHSDAWYNRGLTYLDQNNKERAIADFREAIRVNPGDEDARNELKRLGVTQ